MQDNSISLCDKKLFQFFSLCKKNQISRQWIENVYNKVVINSAVSSNAPKFPGYTLLHFAVKCNNRAVVGLLLEYGADYTLKNSKGQTPLHLGMLLILLGKRKSAYWKRTMELILEAMLLADKTEYANPLDNMGLSHFHIACFLDNYNKVLGFLNHGVELSSFINFNSPYWPGYTALHIATKYSKLMITKLLVKFGAKIIDANDAAGLSPLHHAIINCDEELVDYFFTVLSANGMNPVESIGFSMLHVYCTNAKNKNCIINCKNNNCLLDKISQVIKDIHVSVKSDSPIWAGYTPLHVAVHSKNIFMIFHLVKLGANINAKDVNGTSLLQLAIRKELINEKLMDLILVIYNKTALQPVEEIELFHLFSAVVGGTLSSIEFWLNDKLNINRVVPLKYPLSLAGYTPLHFAVERGCVEIMQLLLANGADPCIQDINQMSPLHLGVKKGNFPCDVVRKMLSFNSKITKNPIDSQGLSHFHIACMFDMVDLVEEFLVHGVSVNLPTKDGELSLHFAVRYGCEKSVKLLLEYEADFTAQDIRGFTPLHVAIQTKNDNFINIILSQHSKNITNSVNPTGLSHFHIACMKNNVNLVKAFLKSGSVNHDPVELNSAAYAGFTPLHFAVKYNCADTIKVLLRKGADITAQDAMNKVPLHYLSKLDFQDSKLILDLYWSAIRASNIKLVGTTGLSALHVACMRDDSHAVEEILERDSKLVNDCTDSKCPVWPGFSPLHFAVKYGSVQTIEVLLRYNSDLVNSADKYDFTPLHVACAYSKEEVVAKLLASGSDPAAKCISNGLTPLRLALQANNMAIVRSILYQPIARISRNPMDNRGFTYFHIALLKNLRSVVEKFLQSGVDVNEPIHPGAASKFAGCTPLHVALRRRDARMAELLLAREARVEELDNLGRTPLQLVCFGSPRLAELLLMHGAKVEARNALGESLVELALKRGCLKVLEFALRHGADATAKTSDGSTYLHRMIDLAAKSKADDTYPRKLAEENYYERVVLLLMEHNCNLDTLDGAGRAGLHRAYWPLNLPALRALLRCGADVNVEDRSGRTVVSYLLEIRTSRMPLGELRSMFREHLWLRVSVPLPGFRLSANNEALYRTLLEDDEAEDNEAEDDESGDKGDLETEIQRMRNKCFGCHTSLYEMLREPENRMAWCLENPELLNFLRSGRVLEKDFPHCGCLIRMQYARALRRKRLLRPAVDAIDKFMFERFTEASGRDDACARSIIEYLDNQDLSNLAALL